MKFDAPRVENGSDRGATRAQEDGNGGHPRPPGNRKSTPMGDKNPKKKMKAPKPAPKAEPAVVAPMKPAKGGKR